MVKTIRVQLDISQQELSKVITPLSETNLVGLVESEKTTTVYNDTHLNLIAKAFSEKAKKIAFEKDDYTILDLYPPDPSPEKSVVKKVKSTDVNIDATATLKNLIDGGDSFFLVWRTVREITEHCNNVAKRNWKTTDLTSIIGRAVANGKLIRQGDDKPKYKKA